MRRLLLLSVFFMLIVTGFARADWNPLNPANAPRARYGHSAVSSNGNIYLYGGTDGQQEFNDLYKYTGDWQQIQAANPPAPRSDHVSWANGDRIYIMGGKGNGQLFNDLWVYDTTSGIWNEIETRDIKPGPRYGHAAVVLPDGRALISAGTDASGQKLRDLWALSTDNTYTRLADNVYHTSHHKVHFQGEYMYFFSVPGLMSKYNITTNQWGHFNAGPPLQGYYSSALVENE